MNREQIRQKIKETPLKQEEIFIDEWESKVIVKELAAKSYLEIAEKGNKSQEVIPYLIISSVYTEDGALFTSKDTDLVLSLPPNVLNRLLTSINKLNGLDSKN